MTRGSNNKLEAFEAYLDAVIEKREKELGNHANLDFYQTVEKRSQWLILKAMKDMLESPEDHIRNSTEAIKKLNNTK